MSDCPHVEAVRHVGHTVVTYTCTACDWQWTVRLLAGREHGRPPLPLGTSVRLSGDLAGGPGT